MNYYLCIVHFLFNIIYYDINWITHYYGNELFPVKKFKQVKHLDLFVLAYS